MEKERDIYTLDIVFLGNFNPVIITPQWLAYKNLIRESESIDAKILVIHDDITKFELNWLSVDITRNKLIFRCTKEPYFNTMKDLIISILSILKETPINSFGFNHLYHFSLRSPEQYYNFGSWLSNLNAFSDVLDNPKLQTIQFVESDIELKNGKISLTIQPSLLLTDKKSVCFNFNHHFENDHGEICSRVLEILNNQWDNSILRTKGICEKIWLKTQL